MQAWQNILKLGLGILMFCGLTLGSALLLTALSYPFASRFFQSLGIPCGFWLIFQLVTFLSITLLLPMFVALAVLYQSLPRDVSQGVSQRGYEGS